METNELYVYLDCTAFDDVPLVGILRKERIPGKETYSFEFSREWLNNHGNLWIDPCLQPYVGAQYVPSDREMFNMLSDALPDRWGRLLLDRREMILSKQEGRSRRTITGFDALALINDFGRRGGLRFKTAPNEDYSNTNEKFATPPFARLRDLENCITHFEEAELNHLTPEAKWLLDLVAPGSSLGGARPKANVIDEHGILWVAKFPSKRDIYDLQRWEHFSHLLARNCGINVAETKLVSGIGGEILLSKRFDRTLEGKRIHMASAMTMCGLIDGDNASNGHGYLDIIDALLQRSFKPEHDAEELYRRVAFNICIGNVDDHFRNHSFLLGTEGWSLSPAYDMNPTNEFSQALLINKNSSESDLKSLLRACEDYMIESSTARDIIVKVQETVAHWKQCADQARIPHSEQSRFSDRFAKAYMQKI